MIRACIFDLDGVIVDTAHYHFLAWKKLAEELGYHLTIQENERLKGVSRMQSLEIILSLAGLALSHSEKEALAEKKNVWFIEYVERMLPEEIFPGVRALIDGLRKHGISIGLASSSKNAARVMELLNIQTEFDAVVDGTMIEHTKPHPEIFLKTAKLLGVEPRFCVVLEDAEAGVDAALAAGMRCIGIGSPDLLHRAHVVFPRTSEVKLSMLREMEPVDI